MTLFTVPRCITELVENAIDAGATCIAVKLNLPKFQIQVVDNGNGVESEHLDFIGTRNWTTKCSNLYEHRGESLANIINSCSKLMIVSRTSGNDTTYCKVFENPNKSVVVVALHRRIAKGVTIIINNIFGNFPIRQQRIVPSVEIQKTIRLIQCIALMHPSILFIVKDDDKNTEVRRIIRTSSTLKTLRALFPQVITQHSPMIKVVAEEDDFSVRAIISKKVHVNCQLQFVFVNKRYVRKSEIRSRLDELLSQKGFFEYIASREQKKYRRSVTSKICRNAIFIVNICCPRTEYSVTSLPDLRKVDFKQNIKIQRCLSRLVDVFWQKGAFDDSVVPKNSTDACTKSKQFGPKLFFERLNEARTIRGLPVLRQKVAANIFPEMTKQSNVNEPSCSISDPAVCDEPSDTVHSENEDAAEMSKESTHQSASRFTPCTPQFTRVSEKPILSAIDLLNHQKRLGTVDVVTNDMNSFVGLLNTDNILTKMRSLNSKESAVEGTVPLSASAFPLNKCRKKYSLSYAIKTNSSIRLYEVKKKYYLRKKKILKGKSKLMEKTNEQRQRLQQKSNAPFRSAKKPLIKNAILKVDDDIYELKTQFSEFTFNPTIWNSSPKYSDVRHSHVSPPSAISNGSFTTVFSRGSARAIEEANYLQDETTAVANSFRNETIGDHELTAGIEVIPASEKIETVVKKAVQTTADFICVPSVDQLSRRSASLKVGTASSCHSKFEPITNKMSTGSPELFEFKIDAPLSSWHEVYSEEAISCTNQRELAVEKTIWFPGVHSSLVNNFTLNSVEKRDASNGCEVPQCPCNCHLSAGISKNAHSGRLQNVLESPCQTVRCSSQPISRYLDERPNAAENQYEESCSYSIPIINDDNNATMKPDQCISQSRNISKSSTNLNYYSRKSTMSPPSIDGPNNHHLVRNDKEVLSGCQEVALLDPVSGGNYNVFGTETVNQCRGIQNDSFEFSFKSLSVIDIDSADDSTTDRNLSKIIYEEDGSNEKETVDNLSSEETGCDKLPESTNADNSFCFDLDNFSSVNPAPDFYAKLDVDESSTDVSCQRKILLEKMRYRRNSKFLKSISIHDIPEGILDFQNAKSKSFPFEESEVTSLQELVKPCKMKNHLTIDDYGNSCLRIFPILKKIDRNSGDSNEKLGYGCVQEDINCSVIFSKADLKSVKFLTQLNQKFLLSSIKMSDTGDEILVLFDQHAVDERIRVERLCKEYTNENGTWRSIIVNVPLSVRVSQCEISIIKDFQSDFLERGLDFDMKEPKEFSDNQILINVIRIPLCLHNKALKETTKSSFVSSLKQLTEAMVKELTNTLIRTHGISRHNTPELLQNIINSEACRGAVKFGQPLSSDICSTLLQSLWTCNVPFQCAHGRPLLTPLVNIAKLARLERQVLRRTLNDLNERLLSH